MKLSQKQPVLRHVLFLLLVVVCPTLAFSRGAMTLPIPSTPRGSRMTSVTRSPNCYYGGTRIIRSASSALTMGLYDQPLPPRPEEPADENKNIGDNDDDDDDDDENDDEWTYNNRKKLFSFQQDGTEARGLLPRLSRRLDSGIGCYFEPTDRKVVNLVEKTECHPEDAAWALEACKGDMTEAWTRISTARRTQLIDDNIEKNPLMREVKELMTENDFEDYREKMKSVERQQRILDAWKGGEPDQKWLPIDNPKPVDDEPWFTG